MTLFNVSKKKELQSTLPENRCGIAVEGIFCVKVLGSGCSSCHKLYENTKAAIIHTGTPVEAEYVTDMVKIMEYGAMRMPALVINDKVVSMGRILKPDEIEVILRKFA